MSEKQDRKPEDSRRPGLGLGASQVAHRIGGYFSSLPQKPWFISFSSSLLCIMSGLLIGLIILLFVNPQVAFQAFGKLFVGGFTDRDTVARFIYQSVPIMMTGLAVAFTFKAGLFNIGGAGQYVAGALFALIGVLLWGVPWYVGLLLAMAGGAAWGFLPGFFKAFFNVNEVLSAIMLNWIALIAANIIIANNSGMIDPRYSSVTYKNITLANANGVIPSWGLDSLGSNLTISIFISVIIAVIIWVIISKTDFGFEIKSCGMNKHAAKYAGISDKKNIILAFVISGALAGIGGGIYYLSPSTTSGFSLQTSTLPQAGFDGISVALLAANNPIGSVFTALLISYLTVSGDQLQSFGVSPNVVEVMIGVIVYFASFFMLVKLWLSSIYSAGFIRKAKAFICGMRLKASKMLSGHAKKASADTSMSDREIEALAGKPIDSDSDASLERAEAAPESCSEDEAEKMKIELSPFSRTLSRLKDKPKAKKQADGGKESK